MKTVGNSRKSELIKIKLAEIIQRESIPGLESVTIVSVKTSPDLKTALVLFSSFQKNDAGETEDLLNNNAKVFQARLGKTLKTRNTPKLKFVYDKGFDYSEKIDTILNSLKSEESGN